MDLGKLTAGEPIARDLAAALRAEAGCLATDDTAISHLVGITSPTGEAWALVHTTITLQTEPTTHHEKLLAIVPIDGQPGDAGFADACRAALARIHAGEIPSKLKE